MLLLINIRQDNYGKFDGYFNRFLTSFNGGDGSNLPANVGGLDCRQNAAGSAYFYFGIDEAWALTGNRQDLYVTIHYFDNGTGWLRLEYDSTGGGAYKQTPIFNRKNSNTWKAKTWHITDAWCGNRQNFGADFRITGSGTYYLDLVYVHDFVPAARKRAMTPRFFNGTAYDSQPFRDLMSNLGQWPNTMAKIGTISTIPDLFSSYTDTEVSSWMMQIQNAGKMFEMEVPAIKSWGPTGADTFNAYKPIYDRIVALGGSLDGFNMDEPFYSVRHYGLGTDQYAVNETANWISYVRAWYPETKIGSIEPYSSISAASMEWWVAAVNDRCAAIGVEGLDSFVIDPYWAPFPNAGSYAGSKGVCDWCHNNGIPFSMIYWAAKNHATDADWYNGIMQEGSGYQAAGLNPDRFMVESWLAVPVQTIPETQNYSFTKSVLDFFNTYAP